MLLHAAKILYHFAYGIGTHTGTDIDNTVETCIIPPNRSCTLQTCHHHISDPFLCQQVWQWFACLCGLLNKWDIGNKKHLSMSIYVELTCYLFVALND